MSNKKDSASAILLSTFLLTSTLLFGVVQCSTSSGGVVLDLVESNRSDDLSYLVINEFMADNGVTIAGPDGNKSPDWIELFNGSNRTIDLSGMYLTDDLTDPTCWQFPEGTMIGPGGYLIAWADRDGGELYASFGLNRNGEEIGLFDSDGVTLIDSVVFEQQVEDVSYGRVSDGSSNWDYLLSATPGFSNQEPSLSFSNQKPLAWSLVVLIIAILVMSPCIFLVNKISIRMENDG